MPDADIPQAVRETGVDPVDVTVGREVRSAAVAARPSTQLLGEVEGSIAVVTAGRRWAERLAAAGRAGAGGSRSSTRMSTKGLEYDATVVVDPEGIVAESPGGVRVLYVALTRAAHRMHVLRPA